MGKHEGPAKTDTADTSQEDVSPDGRIGGGKHERTPPGDLDEEDENEGPDSKD